MTDFDQITSRFATPEAQAIYGEHVTIAEHMLQAAALATRQVPELDAYRDLVESLI